jgi:hypothetical protein
MRYCACEDRYVCIRCITKKILNEALRAFRRVCSLSLTAFHQILYGEVGPYRLFLSLDTEDDVTFVVVIKDGEFTVLEYPSLSVSFDIVSSVVLKDEALLRKRLENPSDLPEPFAAVFKKGPDFTEFAAIVNRELKEDEYRGRLTVYDPELYGYFRSLIAMALIVK